MDNISTQIHVVIKNLSGEFRLEEFLYNTEKTSHDDLCWCGSEKLFKECHIGRDKLRKISSGELKQKLSEIFDSKEFCCASFDSINCDASIKGAHSIQRSRVLSSFSKDGHVGTFYRNTNGFENIRDIKTGVKRQASIFYGFCSYHDTELFKNIENKEFSISPENCWASSYRAICHEFYQKNVAKDSMDWLINNLDQGRDLCEQVILQKILSLQKLGINLGFDYVLSDKKKYEKMHIGGDYDHLSSYVVELDTRVFVALCAVISPYFQIDGKYIQGLDNLSCKLQYFTISTVTINEKVTYIISYLRGDNFINEYLKNVFSKDWKFIKGWLFNSIFAYVENFYFDLDWWSSLSLDLKEGIYKLAISENYTKPIIYDDEISKAVPGVICSVTHI